MRHKRQSPSSFFERLRIEIDQFCQGKVSNASKKQLTLEQPLKNFTTAQTQGSTADPSEPMRPFPRANQCKYRPHWHTPCFSWVYKQPHADGQPGGFLPCPKQKLSRSSVSMNQPDKNGEYAPQKTESK